MPACRRCPPVSPEDAAARARAREHLTRARRTGAELAASGRLGDELTPLLEEALLPQIDAAIADLDDPDVPLEAVARLSASLPDAVLALSGPLGLAPGLRPVHEDVVKGLAAL